MMEKQNENQLGNRIAELRKEAGLTQEQLAGKLGVTYQAVSKWENGNSYPDISLLPRLSEIFQVSLDSLFGKEDTILTERVLEKAVRAAAWEEEDSQQAEDLEPAPQTQGQTPCEDGAQMDMAQEDTASQQQRESTDKRESDPARSFGEYISNIVNMSLKSGMNGLGKAMDTLKKIDLKNLDLKGLDQVVNDKVKRAVEKSKKVHIFTVSGDGKIREEKVGNDDVADAGNTAAEEEHGQPDLYSQMEDWGAPVDSQPGQGHEDLPWDDDGRIRAVVYVGRNMISAREYRSMRGRFTVQVDGPARDVVTYMNVSCDDVEGNVQAGGEVDCDTVRGNVGAGGNVSCDSVTGSVFAGESVSCDTVNGDVVAGGNETCDCVNRNVTAGGRVECDYIQGNVSAPEVKR